LRFNLNKRLKVTTSAKATAVNCDALIPLEQLNVGEWADVEEVAGEPSWVGRMAELGVRVGCRLCVLQPGSPCLLEVGGGRLCLRGDCLPAILVRPVRAVG
jgi:ferrous iron transport protein A